MEDKKQNTGVIFPDDNGGQLPTSVNLSQDSLSNSQALSSDPVNDPLTTPVPIKKSQNVLIRLMRRADVILALLLVLGGIGLTWRASSGGGEAANTVTSRFDTTEIPLQELITEQGIDFGTQSVTINGPFQLNDTFVIAPSLQPSNATAGQIYYDQASNILNYYNGTAFVPLVGSTEQSSSVQSVGDGLALNNGQLSNTGVLSLQGQTGDVTLTAGNGIGISGTTITNNGVVSLVSGNSTLVITDNGNGNLVLTVDVGGAGVTSLNGQSGALNLANASGASGTVTIDDASTSVKGIAQFNGTNFQVASGVVNTIQNINTGATPTFAGVNTNSITPSAALTVGATGQQLTLQGNASTQLTATGGGFTTALGFTGVPVGNVTYNLDRAAAAGTYTICTTVGNCTGTGGGVSTSGGSTNRLAKFTGAQTIGDSSISDDGTNVTASSDLIIQGGDVTIGVISTQTGTINLAHSGSSFLGSFVQGALTDNRQYLLPDAGGTVCLSTGNCSGTGSANTLQAAYDAGNTITTSNARNVAITMADTATDSNFLVNLECDTACGANGRFAIQDDAVDVFTILPAGGAVNFINAVDSTQAFNIEENGGGNLFTADTVNSRVGINLGGNNVPVFGNGSAQGLVLNGALRVIGSTNNDTYTTPNGVGESARLSVQNYDVAQFGQVIAVGLTSGSHANARAIGVYDDRTGNHQPAIAVFSVDENDAFGLSWEGSTADAYLKTLGSDVNIRINTTDAANFTATSVNLLQNTSVTGTLAVSAMGATDTSSYLCRNTLNQLSTCAASGAGSAFVQGGNSFGATAILGTNDANALQIETSGVTRLTVAADGSNVTLASNTDLLLQGASAYISNPQGSVGPAEGFGLNVAVDGSGTAVGNQATAGTGGAFGAPVAFGFQATALSWGTAIGGQSSNTGVEATALGQSAVAAAQGVALGANASTAGDTGSIALGFEASTTASSQLVIGSNNFGITHAVIGSGVTDATPSNITLQGTSGSGTNIAGANMTFAAGQGTGSALGGNILFQSSEAGASGATLNGLTTLGTLSTTSFTLGTNLDMLLQGASAFISNPQTQTNGESFGLNATVTGANGTALGNGATAVNNGVSIGYLAGASGGAFGGPVSIGEGANGSSWGVAVGQDSSTTGNNAVAIGNAATAAQNAVALGMSSIANSGGIAIGHGANTGGNDRIVIGRDAAATADFQMVVGSSSARINHVVIGNGVTNAAPLGFVLQATSGTGTNIAGANVDIAAGQSTGNANGGSIAFRVSGVGASGTGTNSLVTVGLIQGGTGAVNFANLTNSTSAFNVENSAGGNLFTIDTVNSRVGINLGGNNVPTMSGDGLEVNGGVKISGVGLHSFLTPLGSSIDADLSINTQTVGDFDQVIALGISSTSADTSRGIFVADARGTAHQPSIAVLSPNENEIGGFSWDGSSVNFLVKNTNASGTIGLNVGGTTRLQATSTGASVTGIATISALGTASNSTYLCYNASNQIAACTTTGGAGAAFIQGGNSFGQTAILGTNDGFGLNFEVNTTTVMTISTVGAVNLQNQTDSVNAFRIQNADASATVFNVDTTNQRVGIGGAASFSKFEVQGGDAAIYNSGANPRLILGDSTTAGQNGFLQWDSTNDYFRIETVGTNGLKINDNFISIGNLFPDQPLKIGNGTTLLAQVNTTGQAMFQNSADSTSAFRILNAAGNDVVTSDTLNRIFTVNGALEQNITAQDAPQLISAMATTNYRNSQGMDVQGNYAYTVSDNTVQRLNIVDITDPANPVEVSSTNSSQNLFYPKHIRVKGNYAYIVNDVSGASANRQFVIYDISNPNSPTLKGFINDAGGTVLDRLQSLEVVGNYAYVASRADDNFSVIDISDPANPVVLATITDTTNLNGPKYVTVQGKYAYVSLYDGDGLAVIDISDPNNPTRITTVGSVGGPLNGANGSRIKGKYLYVAAENNHSFTPVNIEDPTAPVIGTALVNSTVLNLAQDLDIFGDYAVVAASGNDRLAIVDISTPATPALVSNVQDATNLDGAQKARMYGRYIYAVADGDDASASVGAFSVWEIGGFSATSADIGELRTNNLFVDSNAFVSGLLTVQSGLNVGGAVNIQGGLNVTNGTGVPIFTVDVADNVLKMGGTDTGIVMVAATNEPGSTASNQIRIYGKSIGGRLFPKWKGPSGPGYATQTAFFGSAIGMILPQSNGNISNMGLPTTFSGISWPNLASTNLRTSMKRNTFTTAAGADSSAAIRSHETLTWRGNAAGLGGFFYSSRFAVSTTVTNQRIFVGLHDDTGAIAGNQVISNLTDMIGAGWDSADTNLQIMHNDASGTATKVDLGASFPANSTTAVYELRLFAAPNGSTVAYEVTRLDTGSVTTGTLSTNLPPSTTFLTQHMHINNGGTASAAAIDMMHIYLETDY